MKKLEMIINKNRNIAKNIRNAGLIIAIVFINACGRSARENVMLEAKSEVDKSVADSVAVSPELATKLDVNTKTPVDKKFIKTANVKFKVNNALYATEKIEDLTSKYGGYILYSNLQNRNEGYKRTKISRDSILISTQISVMNNIQLKVPNENLDSFIRQLNPLVSFLDYRIIKMDDVTLQYISNKKKAARLQNYEKRQAQHIDSNKAKLRDVSDAEDNLLDHQNQSDDLFINSMGLDNDVNYCTITMEIYQKSIIVREVIPNFDYVSASKPNIIKRIGDSIVQGWWILEEIIVFLVNIWGILVLLVVIIFGIKYLRRLYKKM